MNRAIAWTFHLAGAAIARTQGLVGTRGKASTVQNLQVAVPRVALMAMRFGGLILTGDALPLSRAYKLWRGHCRFVTQVSPTCRRIIAQSPLIHSARLTQRSMLA